MSFIEVDAVKCKKDGLCAAVCPSGCLEEGPDGAPMAVDPTLCNGCGHCVAVCPHGALANARVDAGGLRPAIRTLPPPEAVDVLLRGRRSIRVYADRPVPRDMLGELLDVARYAPTASNAQEIRWIVADTPTKVRDLAALTAAFFADNGFRPQLSALWERGRDVFLRGAPALAVVHTPSDTSWGAVDTGIALTFMELAAVSRGLGTCWAGLLTYAAAAYAPLRQALGVPDGHTVHGGLMLGYPKLRYAAVPPRNPAVVNWL
jgi:nitroreductase/NAD-dependent dihydropyrimidine dehydrogenase PreA subunit